jgi:protein SCO1/2
VSSPASTTDRTPDISLRPRGLWIGFVVLALGIPLIGFMREHAMAYTPPFIELPLPAFDLTTADSKPFSRETLHGRVWVADFIFTTCPTVCPKLTKRMGEIQDQTRDLGEAFQLVSFTVDPENDTPDVLARYAEKNGATNRWTFVTGPLDKIEETVMKGFKIAMGKADSGGGLMTIFHGEKLVLVDAKGAIRGYFSADDEGIALLLKDARGLIGAR